MAARRLETRTQSVASRRMRSVIWAAMARRLVRRMLLICGIAVAGWLLGSVGPAHAAGTEDPAPVATAAGESSITRLAVVTKPHPAAVPRTGKRGDRVLGKPRAATGAVRSRLGLNEKQNTPAIPGVLDLPDRIVRGLADTAGLGMPMPVPDGPDSRTPRHSHSGTAADKTPAVQAGQPADSGASESRRDTAPGLTLQDGGQQAPDPVTPHLLTFHSGVLPAPANAGAGPGRLARQQHPAIRPAAVKAPPRGAVPPAIRTAADEPALSPD